MASGPTPQTRFEAWGQAIIGVKNTGKSSVETARGLLALIMISDTQRKWAAWYYFNSKYEVDIQLLGNYVPEILGEKPKYPSHFMTNKAMRVDQLCGDSQPFSGRPFRLAALSRIKRDLGDDLVELLLFVQNASPGSGPMNQIGGRPTTQPIHLRFQQKDGASDVGDYPLGFGWLTYTGIYERFNFLWPYHSTTEKLRAMENMLLHRGGPEFRLGT